MRAAGAAAVSAAMLLAPSCGRAPDAGEEAEALLGASYRAAAARDLLASCPGSAARPETAAQFARLGQLRRLSEGKRAWHPLWQGENQWQAVRRRSAPPRCGAGARAYREALAAFSRSLDALAAAIRDHRE